MVGARHRFYLEVAFRLQKANAKLLNDALYAILCCQLKKFRWSDPGPEPTYSFTSGPYTASAVSISGPSTRSTGFQSPDN
jgi:hypothetical protein